MCKPSGGSRISTKHPFPPIDRKSSVYQILPNASVECSTDPNSSLDDSDSPFIEIRARGTDANAGDLNQMKIRLADLEKQLEASNKARDILAKRLALEQPDTRNGTRILEVKQCNKQAIDGVQQKPAIALLVQPAEHNIILPPFSSAISRSFNGGTEEGKRNVPPEERICSSPDWETSPHMVIEGRCTSTEKGTTERNAEINELRRNVMELKEALCAAEDARKTAEATPCIECSSWMAKEAILEKEICDLRKKNSCDGDIMDATLIEIRTEEFKNGQNEGFAKGYAKGYADGQAHLSKVYDSQILDVVNEREKLKTLAVEKAIRETTELMEQRFEVLIEAERRRCSESLTTHIAQREAQKTEIEYLKTKMHQIQEEHSKMKNITHVSASRNKMSNNKEISSIDMVDMSSVGCNTESAATSRGLSSDEFAANLTICLKNLEQSILMELKAIRAFAHVNDLVKVSNFLMISDRFRN